MGKISFTWAGTIVSALVLLFFSSGVKPAFAFCPSGGTGTIAQLPPPPGTITPPSASAPLVTPPSGAKTPSPVPVPSGTPIAPAPETASKPEVGAEATSGKQALSAVQQIDIASSLWEPWWQMNQAKFLDLRTQYPFEKIEGTEKDDFRITTEKEYKQLWEFLISNFQNKDADMRYPAITALAKTQDKFAATEIEKMWNSDERDVLDTVVISMGMLKDNSQTEKLIGYLKDTKNHKVTRGFAAFALGFIGHKPAIDIFREIITNDDQDWEVQCACEMSMGLMKSSDCVDFLGGILNPPEGKRINNSVRAYAALALGRIGGETPEPHLKKALDDSNDEVKRSAVIAIGQAKYKDCKDVLIKMMESDKDLMTNCFAAISLGELGDETAFEPLVKALHSTRSLEIQGFAALSLGLLGNKSPEVINPLKELVSSARELEPLRCAAALALGILKDKESFDVLMKESGKKQYPRLRKYCVLAIGLIGENDKTAVKNLKELMEDSKKRALDVYKAAAYSLILMGEHKTVLKQLKDDLKTENTNLKLAVLDIIGRAGDNSMAETLMNAFKTEKQKITRQACLGAIGCLLDRNFDFPMLKNITTDNNYYVQLIVINHVLYIP